jgi:DNA helicase-2/ATP-dependent DNA helicase PcrA
MPRPDEVLTGLNDQQRQAVTHLGGPLLIVAGAGSGKTRTLTRRFQWLVAGGVPVDRILAMTYTKEAAEELATRIEEVLGEQTEEINAKTFHSLCTEILRDEHASAGINPFFTIANEADRVAIMLARLAELDFQHTPLRGNPAAALGKLTQQIDNLKEECISPEQLAEYAQAALTDAVDEETRERALLLAEQAALYAKHEQFLRDAAALDFGGLQFELWKLLSGDEELRRRIARRYDHILVDEFQDTTWAQLEILKLLAQDHGNIAAVGDDDQSIYGFRGASAGSILHFERRFGAATRIELELNYRSAAPIIDTARAIVTRIPDQRRVPKELTAADSGKPGEVLFWKGANEVAETQAIVTEIERLIADAKVQPREICVITAARKHMKKLADRLSAHGIPFVMNDRDFFKSPEIRVPLSWLKVLANPTLNEDAWRMLTAQPVNLDSADYAALMRWMKRDKRPHVIEAMRSAARSKQFSPETLDRLRQFLQTFDALAAQFDELGPGEFTIRMLNTISIKGSLLLDGNVNAPDRFANLSKFQSLAEEYENRSAAVTARDFANYITAMAEAGFEETCAKADTDPNAVQLMTAHGSKGLEFEYVFIPGMISRRWPGSRRGGEAKVPDALVHDPLPLPEGKDAERDLYVEERRRLCHVAMTRAKTQLVLSWHDAPSSRHKVGEFYSEALLAAGGEEQAFAERDFETADFVHAELENARDQLLASVAQAGQQLGEMRLDAHSDTPADFARFAELLKLSALTERLRHGQTIADALPEINAMLTSQMTPAQKAAFESSELDDRLTISEHRVEELGAAIAGAQPQLSNFLPVTGNRLRLSASAIGSYQRCPKLYEFDSILRIPTPNPSHLKLGIAVHNVLERFHRDLTEPLEPKETAARLNSLLDQTIATGGWGGTDDERQLIERARTMLGRYAESEFARGEGEVQTEVNFSVKLDPTPLMRETLVGGKTLDGIQINGKIDRIDTLPDGSQRVVDYKTGYDKGGPRKLQNQVAQEIQLAIYKFAGAIALGVDADKLTYYFLENSNPVIEASATDEHVEDVKAQINEVADKIISLDFTPAPEYMKCSSCAYNQVCPATEA